ncbi:mas-related G-protein coupled receptor member X3-like [Saccopteryx bilineata]|uniref:mas-related G-protein coupled receptor member X3-like n=1 Tax=Saccopteryx bilineata TaxID=59482 RepID=UPI00338E4F81
MALQPSDDIMTFSPRPQPGLLDPSNGSELPEKRNTTSDTTGTTREVLFFLYYHIGLLVALLLSVFGLVGNGTVIWLLGFRLKRNPFSVYVLNLAIVDFTFLLCLNVTVTTALLKYENFQLAQIILPLVLTFNTAGLSLLMAISTERCLSVTFPTWYKCRRPAHLSTTVLTLLIRVHCYSRRRQVTKLYRVILLTVLAFLVLRLPLGLSFLLQTLSNWSGNFMYLLYISCFLAALNSAVNPVIYFFVGRQGQRPGRKTLRELLQSALTEDTS